MNRRQHLPDNSQRQAGMTMVELLVAISVLMIGVLAVAQLVPAALSTNFRSRYDTTALVLSEQMLSLMTSQKLDVGKPLTAGDYWFVSKMPADTDPDNDDFTYSMGTRHLSATLAPGIAPVPRMTQAGTPLVVNTLTVDWPAGRGAGYWKIYTSTEGYSYETRWNVMTFFHNLDGRVVPVGKRIVISTRGGVANPGGVRVAIPVTLVTMAGWR